MRFHLLCAAIVAAISTSAWGEPQQTTPTPATVTPVAAPATSAPATTTAVTTTAPAACVPTPREIRGDGVDNDCDGKIDEQLTGAQLAALVDDEVKDCTCKDATTSEGKKARALALKAMTATNTPNGTVDPASIELVAPVCTEVQLAGYEWDGTGWTDAASASRRARAAYGLAVKADKKADEAKAIAEAGKAVAEAGKAIADEAMGAADAASTNAANAAKVAASAASTAATASSTAFEAKTTADQAKAAVVSESTVRQAADEELSETGATFGVELKGVAVVSGVITRDGAMLRQGTALGAGLGFDWGYWFSQNLGLAARVAGSVLSEGTRGGYADLGVGPAFKVVPNLALGPELIGAVHASGWGLANSDVTSKSVGGGLRLDYRASRSVGIVGGFTAAYDVPSTSGEMRERIGAPRPTYGMYMGVRFGGWRQ